jgi:hypothetical protein
MDFCSVRTDFESCNRKTGSLHSLYGIIFSLSKLYHNLSVPNPTMVGNKFFSKRQRPWDFRSRSPTTSRNSSIAPDSKEERPGNTKGRHFCWYPVLLSYVRRTVDHNSDGIYRPTVRAYHKIPTLFWWTCVLWCLRMSADGTDVAQKNSGVNSPRHTFIQVKPDRDQPGLLKKGMKQFSRSVM